MGDQEDNKDNKDKREIHSKVKDAINEVADTQAGVIFLQWLKHRCYFERSTIVGNPITYEINQLGTIAHEVTRRLYLDIRRQIKPNLRKRIEQ